MKENNIFQEVDKLLQQLEQEYALDTPAETSVPIKKSEDVDIPEVADLDFSNWQAINTQWPEMEYDLFPRWRTCDIPVMLVAGFLGALLSNKLLTSFANLHDKNWMQYPFNEGGHSGEVIDQIRGYLHRFKYGHDLLNPFEVDWANYLPVGSPSVTLLNKVGFWLHHLFQDSFSTEGLPLPGSSYFREQLINGVEGLTSTRDPVYQTFFTLKMRDITAAAFVSGVMTLYVFGTEIGQKRKFFNYRYTSLTIGALVMSIASGLLLTPPSFNHGALLALTPYIVTLFKVNKRVNTLLQHREQVIQNNHAALQAQRECLFNSYQKILEVEKNQDTIFQQLTVIAQNNLLLVDRGLNDYEQILKDEEEYLDKIEMIVRKGLA